MSLRESGTSFWATLCDEVATDIYGKPFNELAEPDKKLLLQCAGEEHLRYVNEMVAGIARAEVAKKERGRHE